MPGSFSEAAAFRYADLGHKSLSLVYLMDTEGVLLALEKRTINIGLFPVVNRNGGLVQAAFEAMGNHLFTPIDELWLEIEHCLLALPGVSLQDITTLASHPQGFAQSAHYLQKNCVGKRRLEWVNTAKAAKDLAEGILPPSTAVIASKRSAELYGLHIMATAIQDHHPNETAFIVVQHHLQLSEESISLKKGDSSCHPSNS